MEFKCDSVIKTAKDYANLKTVEKHDNNKKTMEHTNIETAQKGQHKNPTNPRQH